MLRVSTHNATDVTVAGDALVLPPLFLILIADNEKTQHDCGAAFRFDCRQLFKWMP